MNGKKALIQLICCLFVLNISYGQSGILRGTITDGATGEELIGTNVIVTGTTKGTISDFDGNYTLKLEPGTYNISISFISYETLQFEDIEISQDEVTILDATLNPVTTELDEVKVVARQRERTEAALQVLQRKSAVVLDGVSSQQISRLGDDNAADALKRVTGVSVEGGKYVYVRGLSDRYMVVTLNGAQIPGLDPNKNTVQMDLFPSNLIENMVVHKTFSPEYPSFSGGHVDVVTKDFPEKFTLSASAGYGYNPQANLNNDFLSYQGGKTDWLGMDDGTRDVPDLAQSFYVNGRLHGQGRKDSINALSRSFNKQFSPVRKRSSLNQSYKFSMGNQVDFFGKSLGLIASLSYKNKFNFYEGGQANRYNAASVRSMEAFETNAESYGENEVIWSGLLSANYKLSNNHKIGGTVIRNQNGNSGARYRDGLQNYDNKYVQKRNLEYLQRSLSAYQAKGKHVFSGLSNSILDWQSSYTVSRLEEPDIRDFLNLYVPDFSVTPTDTVEYDLFTNRDPRRRYRDMKESNWDSKVDFSLPFNALAGKSKLVVGGAWLHKFRNSNETQYTISPIVDPEIYDGVPEHYVADSNFISGDSPWYLLYYNSEKLSDQVNSYTAENTTASAYFLLDLPVLENLRVIAGIRYEHDEAEVKNKVDTVEFSTRQQKEKFRIGESNTNDFLPALNITYTIQDNMNIRLAYSKTVTRPAFRERAPYGFYDFKWGATVYGNPELENAFVDNLDLRWEYFFNPGEMVSISAFYKFLRSPIERFRIPKTVQRIEFRNGKDATAMGLEMEVRKRLDFYHPLRHVQVGTNVSLIKSEVKVDSARYHDAIDQVPNFPETRQMFGQAPYIVNSFINYNNPDMGLSSNLAFNVNGPKIVLIWKFLTPDVYEMPQPRLNFNIGKTIAGNWKLTFSADNILNAELIQKYWMPDFNDIYDFDENHHFVSHKSGRTFSLSLSYTIN